MVPSSQLRVYEPLESFPETERARWTAYIESDVALPTAWPYRQTSFHSPGSGNGAVGLMYPVAGEHAYVRRVNGNWFVCPWSIQVSVLTGILAFQTTVPGIGDVLVPEDEADRASSELERLRRQNPGLRDYVATAAWHVPFRWLAAFDDAERILTAEGGIPRVGPAGRAGQRGAVRVRYETELALAVTRLERARDILEQGGMDESIIAPVAELAEWMSGFDADSTLELDYWGLTGLLATE
ncbi:MAG TPA: hypothetical protein VKJ83_01695, partial [Actinomycetota bacterium]|nr:hypothetical protein [Actinomycetota bacterium]